MHHSHHTYSHISRCVNRQSVCKKEGRPKITETIKNKSRSASCLVLQNTETALHNAVLQDRTRRNVNGAALGGNNDDCALEGDVAA